MEKTGKIQIHFILGNKVFACRYAFHAPRVGDEARFNDKAYKITRACWCYDEEHVRHERMNCEIVECT